MAPNRYSILPMVYTEYMIIARATQIGNPLIRKKAKPVRPVVSARTKKIVRDLTDSMRYHGLVGMAAPQIGIGLRIFVSEARKTATRNPKKEDGLRVFINPKIIHVSKKKVSDYEGCGSVAHAGLFGLVARPAGVTVSAFDLAGKKYTLVAKGLLARIIQHEMDHLNGVVFLDRMKDMKTIRTREEFVRK